MFKQLNPRQQEAVKYLDTALLVLAGAGSGKTSVITEKIAYLIGECGINARNITAVTFTNKAAREMKQRVNLLIPRTSARGLTVSTFHHFGLTVIRREMKTLGFKKGFSIFDQQDVRGILEELLSSEADIDKESIEKVQMLISDWKNNLIYPGKVKVQDDDYLEKLSSEIYGPYMDLLQTYNAVDFDDLIMLPVKLFQEHPSVLQKWQNKIQYMLVDEYQDTNHAQYELVKMLVSNRGRLTVVGDDDQSIYVWRGAKPENLVILQEDYPTLKVVKLEQNYRSTKRILHSANQLISNNPHVFEKTLWSDLDHGEKIRVMRCDNEDAECERIATEIIAKRLRTEGRYCEYAVLYRGNHQSRLLEMKLQHYNIPYHMSGGVSFFSRSEVKDVMAYLKLLVNPDDDSSFLRIVNVPHREIGPATLEKVGKYAHSRSVSFFRACGEIGLSEFLPPNYLEKLQRYVNWIEEISIELQRANDPVAVIRNMLEVCGYESWLIQISSSPEVAAKRMQNVFFLLDSLAASMKKQEDCQSIEDGIGRLILRDILERNDEEQDTDRVQLLTLHASKGLEYPHVFLMGLEEGILPHRSSIESENVEEERRLMYVGITRARQTLTITMSAKRKQFGEIVETSPSRFLDEMPQEDIDFFGFEDNPVTEEQSKMMARQGLESLYKSLST